MKTKPIPAILWVLTSSIAGILCAYFFHLEIPLIVPVLVFILLTSLFFVKQHHPAVQLTFLGTTVFFWFLVGANRFHHSDDRNKKDFVENVLKEEVNGDHYLLLRITEPPSPTKNWIRCKSELLQADDTLCSGKIMLYVEKSEASSQLQYGDLIYAHTNLLNIPGPKNPDEFDYRNYLCHENIFYQSFVKTGNWKLTDHQPLVLFEGIYSIRNYCSNVLENSGLSGNNLSVAQALLLGDKTWVSDELMQSYATSGALHILAVSGLHVGIIMLILGFVLNPLKRLRHGKILFVFSVLTGIWFYAVITGLSPSVLRSAVMFSFVIIGQQLQRDTSVYQSLMISATVLILADPHFLFKPGFLLSYSAVVGIVYFYPLIYKRFYFRHYLGDKIWQITSVSLAAQLATLPLSLYLFSQFPNYFILTNLWVIPLSFVILITGIAYLATSAIPVLSDVLAFLLNHEIEFLNKGVSLIESLPFSSTTQVDLRWYESLFLYVILVFFSWSIGTKSRRRLYFSMGFLSVLVIIFAVRKNFQYQQKQLILYSTPGEFHADFFHDGTFTEIMANEGTDQTITRRSIAPHRMRQCGLCPDSDSQNILKFGPVFEFENLRTLYLNQSMLSEGKTSLPNVDAVVLNEISFIPKELTDLWREQKTMVILGPEVSNSLRQWLINNTNPGYFVDILKSGSLIVNF